MRWQAIGLTDRGRKRRKNEDAFAVRDDLRLFVIADGMGGHAGGDVASGLAVDTVVRVVEDLGDAADLAAAARAANDIVLRRGAEVSGLTGMGTTLTALRLSRDAAHAVLAHTGDSRFYVLRGGKLRRLTTDHTWVQREVEEGRLSAAAAHRHPLSSVLTHVLGVEADVRVDELELDLEPADLLLLCSDGLTGMLEDEDIQLLLQRDEPIEVLAAELVESANQSGGLDNITVIVLRILQ